MQATQVQALALLTSKRLGKFVSRFSVGDTWELDFGEYQLLAQDVVAADKTYSGSF